MDVQTVITQYEPVIWKLVNQHYTDRVANVLDKDDLYQRACEFLVRQLPKYDPAKASLSLYVSVVARQGIINELIAMRWQKRNRQNEYVTLPGRDLCYVDGLVDDEGEPYEIVMDESDPYEWVDLLSEIHGLTYEEESAVFARLAGLDNGEIANHFGWTRGKVNYVFTKVREKLEGLQDFRNPLFRLSYVM